MTEADADVEVAIASYASHRHRYVAFGDETKRIVVESLKTAGVPVHNIEARAKDVASFSRKASKKKEDKKPKYTDPLSQITDLTGVRIITYTLADANQVSDFISSNFEVVERTDVGEKRFKEGKFGYQSIHFLIRYSADRIKLPDFVKYDGMICEIQVRTVLQHAWAEIEHDIQYKNQSGLPDVLQRKFIALAGLLEIADREFQNIQDDDIRLKNSISESLQEDLTKGALVEKATNGPAGSEEVPETSVRQLIKLHRYDEATRLYDQKIKTSPNMHTLYQGRAKVKFLSGDRAGAMEDIDLSLGLNPNDPDVLRLQAQIREGNVERIATVAADVNELLRKGNDALERADGIDAFEYYSRAQESGASRPFSIVNKAMACVLEEDFDGAKILLSTMELRAGSTIAVAMVGLYCIIYAVAEPKRFDDELLSLKRVLADCENFAFPLSPLARLSRGIKKWKAKVGKEATSRVHLVFSELDKSSH